jgi:MFS family permease
LRKKYHGRPDLVLFVALYQQVAIGCTFSIISLALPAMSDDFGVDESIIIWVYFMPQLVSGMLSIPLGRAADLYVRSLWIGFTHAGTN